MPTKLIRLDDGTLVEVEAKPNEVEQISSRTADKVEESLDRVVPVLVKVAKPLVDAWQQLNQDMLVEQAEIELGLSFEGEGNIYITKAKAGANLTVKLVLKPSASEIRR